MRVVAHGTQTECEVKKRTCQADGAIADLQKFPNRKFTKTAQDLGANMIHDRQQDWADEVREKLNVWARWTRGNQLIRGQKHVLAAMIQKAAGEVPGGDAPAGYDFTPEIEAVDKSIARMRLMAEDKPGRQRRYIKASKRVLMSVYLGQRSLTELAEKMNCSEGHIKSLLHHAECYVGTVLPVIEQEIRTRE